MCLESLYHQHHNMSVSFIFISLCVCLHSFLCIALRVHNKYICIYIKYIESFHISRLTDDDSNKESRLEHEIINLLFSKIEIENAIV